MRAALAACAVAALGLGTVASGTTAGSDLTLPDGLTLSMRAPRLHAQYRLVTVGFNNQTGESVLVTSLALRTGLFDDAPAEDENVLVYDGRRVDIPVALRAARCPATDTTVTVETTIAVGGGPARSGDIGVDPAILRDINARECDQRYVTDRVDIAFADEYEDRGDSVAASLVLTRRAGSEPAVVDLLRGSVNFGVAPLTTGTAHDGAPLARLNPEDDSVSVPVSIVAERCEPHAMIESKRMFHFNVWVSVGDVQQQAVTIIPEGPLRDLLQAKINECAAAWIEVSQETPNASTAADENGP